MAAPLRWASEAGCPRCLLTGSTWHSYRSIMIMRKSCRRPRRAPSMDGCRGSPPPTRTGETPFRSTASYRSTTPAGA
ncbi:MAG: hypothetical protein MZU97_07145 [Bacillus subtilis]|nr:hypothetical protein [Bacillus subtilis]